MPEDFGEVIDDEPIALGEHLAADHVDLPPWQIGVQAVDEGGIVELARQRLEQVAVLEHERHIVVCIADEGETGLSSHGIDPSGKGFVGHVVLHDVDQRLVGGLLAAVIVYRLAQERTKKTSVYTLILAGVAVGALFSAVTSFTIFLCSESQKVTDVIFWTMGGLGRANWAYVDVLTPIVAFGSVILIAFARDLNALSIGEEGAFHLGIDPEMSKRIMLGVATLLTSSAVAFAGTIGFVGLIIPHIMRLIIGPDHRYLLPTTAIAGAIFLVWADMAARTVASPAEMPVGIITAFLGAPFFLYLLKRKRVRM